MTPEERGLLLVYARRCIEAAAGGRPAPVLDPPPGPLAARGAAFVTIRSRGELRGCIGQYEAQGPLWQCVRDMAEAAARNDNRFDPVHPDEAVQVELSVLTPLVPIRPEEVRVGVHGLLVRLGVKCGLLLPQVAEEWGWTPREFLEHTCRKAGLPLDAWTLPDIELQAFTAEHFSDP